MGFKFCVRLLQWPMAAGLLPTWWQMVFHVSCPQHWPNGLALVTKSETFHGALSQTSHGFYSAWEHVRVSFDFRP